VLVFSLTTLVVVFYAILSFFTKLKLKNISGIHAATWSQMSDFSLLKIQPRFSPGNISFFMEYFVFYKNVGLPFFFDVSVDGDGPQQKTAWMAKIQRMPTEIGFIVILFKLNQMSFCEN
jgi:hypothetical protein